VVNYLSFHLNHIAKPGCRATRPDIEPLDRKEESLMAERRQHPRYRVREGEFEVFSRDSDIMGKLNNISQGGLAFQYSPVEGRRAESATIDIMAKSPDPFFLPSIACRTMYDISVLAEERTFTGAAIRLSGVQFFRLSKEQTQKLTLFIKKYGLEPLEEND
jgi:hypothetical protein